VTAPYFRSLSKVLLFVNAITLRRDYFPLPAENRNRVIRHLMPGDEIVEEINLPDIERKSGFA
jgi:hypothetical protein